MNLTEYKDYANDNPKGLWFKARWYGWGWIPVKWQGWAVLGGFIVVVMLNGLYLGINNPGDQEPGARDLVIFFSILLISVAILLAICVKKGDKPSWNWGDPRKK